MKPSHFDATASSFEHHRSLPADVVDAIRSTIANTVQLPDSAHVLDLGAGTGRMSRSFLAAGDFYFGVDSSLAMLQEFLNKPGLQKYHLLVQADGRYLPFRSAAFDLVLLIQVLSGVGNWREVLLESRRVLRPGGSIAVGHMVSPESGMDAQLKRQLATILEEMQVPWHKSRESRQKALDWLESAALRHVHCEVGSWKMMASAEEFLSRRRTGARFAALPGSVQQEALDKLQAWAETEFGSIGSKLEERRSFELDIFQLRGLNEE